VLRLPRRTRTAGLYTTSPASPPTNPRIPRVLAHASFCSSSQAVTFVGGLDQRLILVCDHGYSSILAAGNLVDLGFRRAGDVIGGFEAWRAVGLPVEARCREPLSGQLPGMAPPDWRGLAKTESQREEDDVVKLRARRLRDVGEASIEEQLCASGASA
jgi:rhodanese-related sulfurtransferase